MATVVADDSCCSGSSWYLLKWQHLITIVVAVAVAIASLLFWVQG